MNLWTRLRTYRRLGFSNLLRVGVYRLHLRSGRFRKSLPIEKGPTGPFLHHHASQNSPVTVRLFSKHEITFREPPDWFLNHFTENCRADASGHWSSISDFSNSVGDIKTIWELSRFDWLPRFIYESRNNETNTVATAELWVRDWIEKNPPNQGVNWKCGQEASLRALNLLVSVTLLPDQFSTPFPGLIELLEIHGRRIYPTVDYAIGQDNNHGTSEAAALFVIGTYLLKFGGHKPRSTAFKWASAGRKLIQERVQRLVLNDGSFAQHSVVYHRMMLDTLSIAELFRRKLDEPPFTSAFYERARLATIWLDSFIDEESHDAPNLGANDGTFLFNINGSNYRDFSLSLSLASEMFADSQKSPPTSTHPLLARFGIRQEIAESTLQQSARISSSLFADGGYACFRNKGSLAIMRLPVFRFRPSQADALHIDLWYRGINIIQDSGTFSYNGEIDGCDSQRLMSGTSAHSTAELDGLSQMPSISRFLYADWLSPDVLEFDPSKQLVRSGYTARAGKKHYRTLSRETDGWLVIDDLLEFKKEATLYWHLVNTEWHLQGLTLSSKFCTIYIESDHPVALSLSASPRSRHYFEYTLSPMLSVKTQHPGVIKTRIIFSNAPGSV